MRKLILAAALAATVVPTVAMADPPPWAPAHGRRDRDDWRESRRYDWNRPDPRYGRYYDAGRYYRDGRYYRERRLTRADRIYRGNDGRYYCRRSDGTTGLVVGAIAGGLLGNAVGGDTLSALIGGAGGALLGRSIDRGNVTCR